MAKMVLAKATYISKRRVGKLLQGTDLLTRVAAAEEIEGATLVRMKNVLDADYRRTTFRIPNEARQVGDRLQRETSLRLTTRLPSPKMDSGAFSAQTRGYLTAQAEG
jgi:hypothetical protein